VKAVAGVATRVGARVGVHVKPQLAVEVEIRVRNKAFGREWYHLMSVFGGHDLCLP